MRRAGAAGGRGAVRQAWSSRVLVVLAGAGCGKKKRQVRTGDAAPVELVSVAALSDAGVGKPGEAEEREPNDGADVATPLAPGGGAHGRIEPDTDPDYYRIDVAEAGGLAVQLAAVTGVDLTLEIEDAGGTTLARSDRGAAGVGEGVPNLGVTPGRYTAIVRKKAAPAKKPPRPRRGAPAPAPEPPPPAPLYQITAQVAPFARGPSTSRTTTAARPTI